MRAIPAACLAVALACGPTSAPARSPPDCEAQLARTAEALPRLEPDRGAAPVRLSDGWCHLVDAGTLMGGGIDFPAAWRLDEDATGARFELSVGPWVVEPDGVPLRARLTLSQPAGTDVIEIRNAWAGWDEDNALVLSGTVTGVRRDSRAARQMARATIRMKAADVELRSRDGFADWIAKARTGRPDRSALVESLDALPLSDAARKALTLWAARDATEPTALSMRITHPEGANIVALWTWLMFQEVDQFGHLARSIRGLKIGLPEDGDEDAR